MIEKYKGTISSYITEARKLAERVVIPQIHSSSVSGTERYITSEVAKRIRTQYRADSSLVLDKDVSLLLEEIIEYETWSGHVTDIEDEHIIIEVHNDKYKDIKRCYRISKSIVTNHSKAFIGIPAHISFKRIRNYSDKVSTHTEVMIYAPVDIPQDIRDARFEEKMKKYSYMLENKG